MARNLSSSGWLKDALCKESDPKLFMSYEQLDIEAAKFICKDCPVKMPCQATYFDVDCVAGGLTLLERLKKTWKRVDSLEDRNWF